jgi:hypothetical protein
MSATYAGSWGLLDRRFTDMSRPLANFAVMDPGACMDAVCDLLTAQLADSTTSRLLRTQNQDAQRSQTVNQGVVGSIPAAPTNKINIFAKHRRRGANVQ